jgi:inner membrane protein
MATVITHAIVAMALGSAPGRAAVGWRTILLGAFCSVAPDFDVIGFRYGIQYGDPWGHRGMTHSLLFAAGFSLMLTAAFYGRQRGTITLIAFLYLFLCTASHGFLDAMTTGGLGVAFFSPFDTTRYFFDFRPVLVSPIGIGRFFSDRGRQVLASELQWIWIPSAVFVCLTLAFRRIWSRFAA